LKALALLTRLTDLDLFEWCCPDAVTDKSLRATLAPLLTGHTRLNLGICDEIDSLTKQGLAEVGAPPTHLTTLLPPAREFFSTESDEDRSDINNYGDWVRQYCERNLY
jgi:hypothetical protein